MITTSRALAALLLVAACTVPLGATARADTRPVVSYIVSATADTNVVLPEEIFPSGRAVPHPWEWRVYNPASGRDTLFLALSTFPLFARWDSTYTYVEFMEGRDIKRAWWKLGGESRIMAQFPTDSTISDFWFDAGDRVHVLTQQSLPADSTHPYPREISKRWDRDTTGAWIAAQVDSTGDAKYGDSFTTPFLEQGAERPRVEHVSALLDAMRLGTYKDSTMVENADEGNSLTWVASRLDPAIGLEMGAAFGDTYHAMEPVTWVDRPRGIRTLVYAKGQSNSESLGQLAFAEREGYLLIVAEYSGAYPAWIDLRTGEVKMRVSKPSARAVWVPAPRGWPG